MFVFNNNLVNEMERIRKDFSRAFRGAEGQCGTCYDDYPPVNVERNEDEVVLHMTVPGVPMENIAIDFDKNRLTITVDNQEKAETGQEPIRNERLAGKFSRTFRVGSEFDPEKIQAKHNNGILSITLPKKEAAKPRKINIE